jgi:hypothetical protein
MEDYNSISRNPANRVVLVFSVVLVVAYGYWELHFPSVPYCGSEPRFDEISRIALIVGWLVYINAFRAQRAPFAAKQSFLGAFSGGGAILIALVGLITIEWATSNGLGLSVSHLIGASLAMLPVTLISGLYSAFAPNEEIAIGQGISCFAFQILFHFLMAFLFTPCTY